MMNKGNSITAILRKISKQKTSMPHGNSKVAAVSSRNRNHNHRGAVVSSRAAAVKVMCELEPRIGLGGNGIVVPMVQPIPLGNAWGGAAVSSRAAVWQRAAVIVCSSGNHMAVALKK